METDELDDLYQELILDHGKTPRNFRELDGATHEAEGFNPLCGDRVHLFIKVKDGVAEDAAFQGSGCAISTASASMMTQAIKGRSVEYIQKLFHSFRCLVTGQETEKAAEAANLGKLEVFSGVQEFPTRVKCAVLVWHTLNSDLGKNAEVVTTEYF